MFYKGLAPGHSNGDLGGIARRFPRDLMRWYIAHGGGGTDENVDAQRHGLHAKIRGVQIMPAIDDWQCSRAAFTGTNLTAYNWT